MRLVRKTRLVAALAALTTSLLLLFAAPASAGHITVTDLTAPGFLIGKEVRKAVFGLNMFNAGGGSFTGLDLVLTDVGEDGEFDLELLSDLAGSPTGVAVVRDNGDVADKLDAEDTVVSTFAHDGNGNVELTVSSSLPTAAEGNYTYFVAVETSAAISNGDDFTVGFVSSLLGCPFTSTESSVLDCPPSDTTETITADTIAPTAALTSPPSDLDDNLGWTFNGGPVIGVTEDNLVLRNAGSSTNLGTAVTPSATTQTSTATINPDQDLEPGGAYVTLVNPNDADTFITDIAGNPVEIDTSTAFAMDDFAFTPGIVRGTKWFLNNQYDPFADETFTYGSTGDKVVVGDWNNDGIFTAGIVRGNRWFLNNDTDGNAEAVFLYGSSTDKPVVGDWDGDGFWTVGVVRGNHWLLNNQNDSSNADISLRFGLATDRPVVGDWNGDDHYTAGVVRGNVWYLNNDPTDPFTHETFAFGRSTDKPVVGDWDGDGFSTPGVVRGNEWFLANDLVPHVTLRFLFGSSSDIPITGDWDASIETSSGGLLNILPGS